MTVEVSDANFDEVVINAEKPVLVDFWAEWCGPCKVIAPVVEELAGDYEGKVKIGKVNVDDHNQVASEYGVRSNNSSLFIHSNYSLNCNFRGKASICRYKGRL